MMEANPQGWKKRRDRARKRSRAMSQSDRQAIRAERARIYAAQSAGPPETAPKPEPAPVTPPEPNAGIDAMSWQEMAAEVRDAGVFVPPKIGEDKLREKLKGIRNEKAA